MFGLSGWSLAGELIFESGLHALGFAAREKWSPCDGIKVLNFPLVMLIDGECISCIMYASSFSYAAAIRPVYA
jgi:hypothetical protein